MSSIVEKLNEINDIKNNIKQAIRDKGVDVVDGTPFAEYPNCIRNIEAGGAYKDFYNIKTNNGTNYGNLFSNYSSSTLDLCGLDTSTVANMYRTFYFCFGLSELCLSDWVTNKVTNMTEMFMDCETLCTLDIRNFDMTNVRNYDNMFSGCWELIVLHLDNCNYDTVNKIINSSGLPTDFSASGRTIYCKQSESYDRGLLPPENWVFRCVDTGNIIDWVGGII